MEGYMLKKSKYKLGGWQKRFFSYRGKELHYWESEDDAGRNMKANGYISLLSIVKDGVKVIDGGNVLHIDIGDR